jgi:N-acetylglucosaminyldiphosphoundecaprenol N-acetyl-beta-D-mannosaminyltransferase
VSLPARAEILGVGFDRLALRDAIAAIAERHRRSERTFTITANPEFVMLARRDPELARIAREADVVLPDGTGAVLASRLLRDPLPGRAPGRFVLEGLVARAAELDASFYLLGAAPGVAQRAADVLRKRYPGLRIAGTHAGSPDPAADAETVSRIAAASPTVLFVAYGMPKQERWIARNLRRLPSVRVAMGVGGAFDYLAGEAPAPPRLVHAVGLEWLWRLAREPQRWRRQRVLPAFALLVIRQALRGRT